MTKSTPIPASNTSFECLEADDSPSEFSDIGSSIDSDLTSLSSSLLTHVYENGRRYHSLNAGTYVLPNDEPEQERLDMLTHATRLILGGALHSSDLPKKLDRVLDCGTGTGLWAISFADEHPDAHVIGIDLSPIQPAWVPPNCVFEVDDLERPWLWKQPFDFIHSSDLGMGMRDWKSYIKNIFDHLAPGGVADLLETAFQPAFHTDDNSIPKGGYIEKYYEAWSKALKDNGILDIGPLLEAYLADAGFVDIHVSLRKLPMGPWPKDPRKKEIGRWGLAIIQHGLKSFGQALFARQLNMSQKEAEQLCDNAFKEFCRRDVHTYFAQWHVWGRKPEGPDGSSA